MTQPSPEYAAQLPSEWRDSLAVGDRVAIYWYGAGWGGGAMLVNVLKITPTQIVVSHGNGRFRRDTGRKLGVDPSRSELLPPADRRVQGVLAADVVHRAKSRCDQTLGVRVADKKTALAALDAARAAIDNAVQEIADMPPAI